MKYSKAIFCVVLASVLSGHASGQEDCGYENGVQRYCTGAYPYIWVFGKESYSRPTNNFHGSAPTDAEWEYMSTGYDSPNGCEQNATGPIVAAPDITIQAAANPNFKRIRAEIPITIFLTSQGTLPRQSGPILKFGLQANGRDLGSPESLDFSKLTYDERRKNADYSGTLRTTVEIANNEELKNVRVVIFDLAPKPSTTIRNLCYDFGMLLGKGRLDLTP
jgi:hypothetical protein